MPATPTYGLRYPAATDRATGDEAMQTLAEDVEAATAALVPDTGSQTNAPVIAEAGWELLVAEYRLIGKVCTLHVWAKRTGAALNSGGSGDPNPGNLVTAVVATVTDPALRPSFTIFNQFRGSLTSGVASLQTSGELWLEDAHTGSSIATHTDELSSTVQLFFLYPIP